MKILPLIIAIAAATLASGWDRPQWLDDLKQEVDRQEAAGERPAHRKIVKPAPRPQFYGNPRTGVYHDAGCAVRPTDTVPLLSVEDAEAKGFRGCKWCRPGK